MTLDGAIVPRGLKQNGERSKTTIIGFFLSTKKIRRLKCHRFDDESDTTHSEDTVTKKKKRKFQPSWKTDYKWLEYDQENSKMFCSVCREFPHRKNVNYSLRIGTNNFQRDSLKAHDESESHYTSSKARSEKEKPREE